MRAVVQRVSRASVEIEGKATGEIGKGLCVFIAITDTDTHEKTDWMINKLINLRIFEDGDGKMNLSAHDTGGEILLVSNFTLYGDAERGYRPSFSKSSRPDFAEPFYDEFVRRLRERHQHKVATGSFGAMMDINIVNDGPVTVIIEK